MSLSVSPNLFIFPPLSLLTIRVYHKRSLKSIKTLYNYTDFFSPFLYIIMIQRSQEYQEGVFYIKGSFPPYNIIIAQSQAICNLQLLDTHPHHDQPQDHPNPAGPRGRAYRELGAGAGLRSWSYKKERRPHLSLIIILSHYLNILYHTNGAVVKSFFIQLN